jgi:hypothetical protein
MALLEESIPTKKELQARQEFLRKVERMHAKKAHPAGVFSSTEEMQREDRKR